MNNIDRTAKDAKVLTDSAKDLTTGNLLNAMKSKTLQVDEATLHKIISILNLSIDEGYQRALPVFQNTIKRYLTA